MMGLESGSAGLGLKPRDPTCKACSPCVALRPSVNYLRMTQAAGHEALELGTLGVRLSSGSCNGKVQKRELFTVLFLMELIQGSMKQQM